MNALRIAGMLLIGLGILSSLASVKADTIFRDTFSDGDAEDGMPVTWLRARQTEISVEDGDLVVGTLGDLGSVGATPVIQALGDTSLRTQFRLREGFRIVNRIRQVVGTGHYSGVIESDGEAHIFNLEGMEPAVTAATDLQVKEEDVVMQLDAFGDTISMWLWRPGESMPVEPLLTLVDDRLATGGIQIAARQELDEVRDGIEAVFRYVHVADMHIPEPTSLALATIGLIGLAGCGWWRRHPIR